MTALRVGIIGARRAAQGIGQYVARDLAKLGASVTAIVGTRAETVAAAAGDLRKQCAMEVRGYLSVAAMLDQEALDAVAICSPQQFHREHLQQALERRLHVLCEKPLVFAPDRDNLADAAPLVAAFAAAGRILMVNQQWPYTLRGFDQCYPDARHWPLTRLEALLAPAEEGLGMIPNAVPHVLSILLAMSPTGGRLEHIQVAAAAAGHIDVAFDYIHAEGRVAVEVHLVRCMQQPRPAGYAINGCAVRRTIRMKDYAMFLDPIVGELVDLLATAAGAAPGAAGEAAQAAALARDGQEGVPLEDPLRLLLADFISRTRNVAADLPADPALLDNVRLLDDVYRAAQSQLT